jgi:tungstate transport system substrate-binding protein
MNRRFPRALLLVCLLGLSPLVGAGGTLRLATTTSTQNSGLLEALLPAFREATGIEVQVIAVGTGRALRLGGAGDVDVVMVHAPEAEERFVAEGGGTRRYPVMKNAFLLIGPPEDPAGIRGERDAAAALRRIAASGARFVSRGDDSGTHKKERALWRAAGVRPAGTWYVEAGQGMGKVLQMADELDAYTLTDQGTWLAYRDRIRLVPLVAGDPRLDNPYAVIPVNPRRHPHVNHEDAMAFVDWLRSPEGQRRIAAFRLHGEQAFVPTAVRLAR